MVVARLSVEPEHGWKVDEVLVLKQRATERSKLQSACWKTKKAELPVSTTKWRFCCTGSPKEMATTYWPEGVPLTGTLKKGNGLGSPVACLGSLLRCILSAAAACWAINMSINTAAADARPDGVNLKKN